MIGKIVTALAGRSIARSVGGSSAGPTGALIGAAAPVLLTPLARRLGPVGMVAAAIGGVALTKYLTKRAEQRKAAMEAGATTTYQAPAVSTPIAPAMSPTAPLPMDSQPAVLEDNVLRH